MLITSRHFLLSLFWSYCCLCSIGYGSENIQTETIFWLVDAVRDYGFTVEETACALSLTPDRVKMLLNTLPLPTSARWTNTDRIKVLPYPGGRHPRIGFLDGAKNPERGTKAGLFAPWDDRSYIVVDLPEAIFSNLGLLFLAHTHIPTIWDQQNIKSATGEWARNPDGSLEMSRVLPNQVAFGSRIIPRKDGADMELWLRNGDSKKLTGLRTQICVLLKGAKGFQSQTNDNKTFSKPVAVAKAINSSCYILTAWQQCGRVWGNEQCPCIHSDPVLPDCEPGQTVRVQGRIIFYEGSNIEKIQNQLTVEFASGKP